MNAVFAELIPYVPRLLLEWQDETPDVTFREIEGTLVFIDLSGFTSMSERLARRGKVGSEEVTDVLNNTFSQLLAVAYEVGGSLLKFGGDALLLFFTGKDHSSRACFAAGEMRRTLRAIGRIKTSAGLVTLKMTTGVHTGKFHFFLVGESHKELIITGPEATKTVAMEASAAAGEILISPETGQGIDSKLIGGPKAGGLLLAKVPEPSEKQAPGAPDVTGDVTPFVPRAIRENLVAGGDEPEHRQVTVAFIHFDGTDSLIAEAGQEEVARRLELLVTAVQKAVDEHDICFLGTDIDKDGGKIILVAGAPKTSENDEEKMLRVLHSIAGEDFGIPIRVGVHRGHVFAGAVGPFYRKTYTVMGDPVNTAARVMSKAERGQLLVTGDVLTPSATSFETTELPPFTVKGKARPLTAFLVGRRREARTSQERHGLPLIGRETELQILLEALEGARAGQGAAVQILGEAGMGKSRLIVELTTLSLGLTTHQSSAAQYEVSTPYYSLRLLLRSVLGIGVEDNPSAVEAAIRSSVQGSAPELVPWIPLLAVVMDIPIESTPEVEMLDAAFKKERLHQVLTQFLDKKLDGPTLLVFEDVHWMDQPSQDFLIHLSTGVSSKPWLIGLTSRPDVRDFSETVETITTLRLEPLDVSAASALARAAANDTLLPQYARLLAERAGGHPLFLQQLVAATDNLQELDALPDSIEAVIAARIDQIEPRYRGLLRFCSVLGHEFELKDLSRLVETSPDIIKSAPDLGSAATWSKLAGYIDMEDEHLRFRQHLFQQVAYEGLPYLKRRTLHERVGHQLETDEGQREDRAELLSYHFEHSQNFQKAWEYSLIAADRAWEKFAIVPAAAFHGSAIRAAKRLQDLERARVCEAWKDLGQALHFVGQLQEAAAAFRQARKNADDRGQTAHLYLLEGVLRNELGKPSQALRWFGRGLRGIQAEGTQAAGSLLAFRREPGRRERVSISPLVRLLAGFADSYNRLGRHSECIRWGERAVAEAERSGDRYGLALAYNLMTLAATAMRDPERGRYGRLAAEIAEETGDKRLQALVLNNIAIDAYYEGDWRQASAMYEKSREAFEAAGDLFYAAYVSNNLAEILSDQGHLEEARKLLLEALGTFRAARFSEGVLLVTSNLGRLSARSDHFEQAEVLLQEAIRGFEEMGVKGHAAQARLAETYLLRGRGQEVLRITQGIEQKAHPLLKPMVHRLQGYARLQCGDSEGAREALQLGLESVDRSQSLYEKALTLQAMARLDEDNRERYESEARAIFDQLGVIRTPEVPLSTLT